MSQVSCLIILDNGLLERRMLDSQLLQGDVYRVPVQRAFSPWVGELESPEHITYEVQEYRIGPKDYHGQLILCHTKYMVREAYGQHVVSLREAQNAVYNTVLNEVLHHIRWTYPDSFPIDRDVRWEEIPNTSLVSLTVRVLAAVRV